MAPVKVNWDDLVEAYSVVDTGTIGQWYAYVSKSTGKVYAGYEEMGEVLGDIPDDADENDDYIPIPGKFELDLGKALVWEFVRGELPEDERLVQGMFSRAGAYRRFKDFLLDRGRLDDWHAFEDRRVKEELTAWCVENGLEVNPGDKK